MTDPTTTPDAGPLATPAAPAAPNPSAPVADGGSNAPSSLLGQGAATPANDWRSSFQDETLRTSESLGKFKGVEDVAKGYVELEKHLGAKGLQIPKPDAPQEVWENVWKSLGRPAKPEEYGIAPPEGAPVSKDELNHWLGEAHAAGLNKAQAEKLIGGYMKRELERWADRQAEGTAQLQQEWQGDFANNLRLAAKAAEWAGGPEFFDRLINTGLADDAVVVKALHRIGTMLTEDSTPAKASFSAIGSTAEQATAKLQTLMANQEWLADITDSMRPGHRAAIAQKKSLDETIAKGR